MKKAVGNRIRKIRLNQEYTQDNMADELNITHSAYAKIERGVTDPQITRLYEIARILKVDITEFFHDRKDVLEDPAKQYGFASKNDIEELKQMMRTVMERLTRLEQGANPPRKTKPGRKK